MRNNPLSTKMQNKLVPIALFKSTAATVESTPPDNPSITLSFPNLFLSSDTVVSIKESGVHDWLHLHMSTIKFLSKVKPSVE